MLEYLRHHQKSVLLVVTVVVCISFGWFYVRSDTGHGKGANPVLGTIYGRDITKRDYEKIGKHARVADQLQLPGFDLLTQGLAGRSLMSYAAAIYLVREEAAKLGLAVTPEEAENFISKLPAFQTNGQFDPAKFNLYAGTGADDGLSIPRRGMFGQMEMGPPAKLSRLGLAIGDLREIVGDYMLLGKLQDLLGAGLNYSDSEAERDYAQFRQKIKASVIRIPVSRFKDGVQITDEEIQKAYEENKSRFMTEEKRAFEYIAIAAEKPAAPAPPAPAADGQTPATPPAAPEEPKEKALARRTLAADIFNEMGGAKSLADIAAARNLKLEKTEPFATSTPPEAIKDRQKLQGVINRLTLDRPEPPPVEDGDTWFIVRLTQIVEPVAKPLEEVKETLVGEIRDRKAREAATKAAEELAAKLKPLIEGGKSFADAAAEAGPDKTEDLAPIGFSAETSQDDRSIARSLGLAKPGTIGEVVQGADTVLVPFLVSREIEKSAEKANELAGMKDRMNGDLRQAVFIEWWMNRMSAAEFVDKTAAPAEGEAEGG